MTTGANLCVQLPDNFQDWYLKMFGVAATAAVLAFCKRELMQEIWKLVLSPEFIRAFETGIIICCGDAILRRLFLRILTYSADYPEKYGPAPLYICLS